jgi:hypothetical protein
MRLANRIARLEQQNGTEGTSYRFVVSAAEKRLDVPGCIQILEAKGVLSNRPGFSLLDLTTKPCDLSSEEWAELGGGHEGSGPIPRFFCVGKPTDIVS